MPFLVDTGADATIITREYQYLLSITDEELKIDSHVHTITGKAAFRLLNNCSIIFNDVNNKPVIFNELSIYFHPKKNIVNKLFDKDDMVFHPNILGRNVLNHEAFFRQSFSTQVVLEVFLTEILTQEEIACYYFHLAELYKKGFATDVSFLGVRHDSKGTILRFQGVSFKEIYKSLANLLAPFRLFQAVDIKESLSRLNVQDKKNVAIELMDSLSKDCHIRWEIARRLGDIFSGFHNARVYQISENGDYGIRIDLFTNNDIASKLSGISNGHGTQNNYLKIITNDSGQTMIGVENMRDKYDAKQVVSQGPNANFQNNTINQVYNERAKEYDMNELSKELNILREHLKKDIKNTSPEQDADLGNLASAEIEAKKGNGGKALEYLSKIGKWVLDTATQIGVRVAAAAINQSLNNPPAP
jgi:hypothetical protein